MIRAISEYSLRSFTARSFKRLRVFSLSRIVIFADTFSRFMEYSLHEPSNAVKHEKKYLIYGKRGVPDREAGKAVIVQITEAFFLEVNVVIRGG